MRNSFWGIEVSPFTHRKVQALFAPPVARTRRISVEEEHALLAHASPLMAARIQMALKEGLRRGEVLQIQNKHLNFKDWVLTFTKDVQLKSLKSANPIPIEDPAVRAFLQSRRFLGPDAYPFGSAEGTYVSDFNSAWLTTLKHAFKVADPIEVGLRYHDLRAECCSRMLEGSHVPNGKPVPITYVAAKLRDRVATIEKHYARLMSVEQMRKVING